MTTEEDSGFIPSTDLIRNAYRALALRPDEESVLVAEFDRWLRERDATNRREAWTEGHHKDVMDMDRAQELAHDRAALAKHEDTPNPYGLLTHEHPKGDNDE